MKGKPIITQVDVDALRSSSVGTDGNILTQNDIDALLDRNKKQVGGEHYVKMELQPWDVMEAILTRDEFVGFLKGNIIKYAMRQGKKGDDDAAKARHYMEKLKEVLSG